MTSSSGSCLCGAYAFETANAPRFVAHCHCSSCRRAVGASITTYVGFASSDVTFGGGIDSVPAYASSPGVRRGFCDRCGTALYYAADRWADEVHLFRSNFERPEDHDPTGHVFFAERERDVDLYDDLPRYDQGSAQPPACWGPRPALRILYLCTGNSARSILAEAITNLRRCVVGERRIRAHSAGSQPTGKPHPQALALLEGSFHQLTAVRSKSWDEFTSAAAPPVDLVITLCDSAASESCPVFPGSAERRHWGLPDPASGAASFEETYRAIESRVDALFAELGARPLAAPLGG